MLLFFLYTSELSLFLSLSMNKHFLSQIWKISNLSNQLPWFKSENQISLPYPPLISTWKSNISFSYISLNLLLVIDLKFMRWIL